MAERDRDRYLASSEANFARFREVERELAVEKEKTRRLEERLEREKEAIVAEYKASQEFEDLLNAEYDASFPETFKMCWETAISELGSKIEGVTLEKFPVPPMGGKKTSEELTQSPIAALEDSEPALEDDLGNAASSPRQGGGNDDHVDDELDLD